MHKHGAGNTESPDPATSTFSPAPSVRHQAQGTVSESVGAASRHFDPLVLLVLLAIAATCYQFVDSTRGVRLANSDDYFRQSLVNDGSISAHLLDEGAAQGRFNFATPLYQVPWLLYRIESPVGFSLARAALYFASITVTCIWLWRAVSNGHFALLFGLVAVAALHLPPGFYPVLSYPAMPLALTALAGAMLAQLRYARTGGFAPGATSGVMFLVACLLADVFLIYAPLVVAQAWEGTEGTPKRNCAALSP